MRNVRRRVIDAHRRRRKRRSLNSVGAALFWPAADAVLFFSFGGVRPMPRPSAVALTRFWISLHRTTPRPRFVFFFGSSRLPDPPPPPRRTNAHPIGSGPKPANSVKLGRNYGHPPFAQITRNDCTEFFFFNEREWGRRINAQPMSSGPNAALDPNQSTSIVIELS